MPLIEDSIRSFVKISNLKLNLNSSSSCHCSDKLPGDTIRQRFKSPLIINSLRSNPVIIVLPAPGSSASMNRKGILFNISSYTADIWCGNGSIDEVCTAR